MTSWSERSVYTHTPDGVLLGGTVTTPVEVQARAALVWVHGWPVSPTLPFTTEIGRCVARLGHAFVAGDTRGHDLATWLFRQDGKPMLGGAWYERFEECTHDVAAWVEHCVSEGFERIFLVGHSFGALKATYYLSENDDPRVGGLVLAAPGVRSYVWGPGREPDEDRTALARELVDTGRGLDLLPWQFEYGAPMGTASARTYLSWLEADELDLLGIRRADPRVSRVRCPILGCYGSEDSDTGTMDDLERMRSNATASPRVEVCLLDGAGHGFVGHEEAFARRIDAWMRTLA